MMFYLKRDKMVYGETGRLLTFVEAGPYEVVRIFDKDRVIVKVCDRRPRQLTLLRKSDGELKDV